MISAGTRDPLNTPTNILSTHPLTRYRSPYDFTKDEGPGLDHDDGLEREMSEEGGDEEGGDEGGDEERDEEGDEVGEGMEVEGEDEEEEDGEGGLVSYAIAIQRALLSSITKGFK